MNVTYYPKAELPTEAEINEMVVRAAIADAHGEGTVARRLYETASYWTMQRRMANGEFGRVSAPLAQEGI